MASLYKAQYQLRTHRRDAFIEFIKAMLLTPFILHNDEVDSKRREAAFLQIFESLEGWTMEHFRRGENGEPGQSKLSLMVPSMGRLFTQLPLMDAFLEYNKRVGLTARRYVPPSFNDVRHILNLAQVKAIARQLRLVTFDGDQTLYEDGQDFLKGSALATLIIRLLKEGINVAVVTAAGYANEPLRYETRLSGLLHAFRESNLSHEVFSRFYVLGGECNYLFRLNEDIHLVGIEEKDFFTPDMREWLASGDKPVEQFIAKAEETLRERLQAMNVRNVSVLCKARGVGLVVKERGSLTREQLDELALAAQDVLSQSNFAIPFCAFNGGNDVWIDVGNKLYGVRSLQQYLKRTPAETLHVGDQFLSTGNDFVTRAACSTVWISSPSETMSVLQYLFSLRMMKTSSDHDF